MASMMKAMMNTMAKTSGMQRMSRDLNHKINSMQNSVAEVTAKVFILDEQVHGVEKRLDDVEAWRSDTKQEIQQMKAKAIAVDSRASASAVGSSTTPGTQRRTSTASSSKQGEWRARLCYIRGFAPPPLRSARATATGSASRSASASSGASKRSWERGLRHRRGATAFDEKRRDALVAQSWRAKHWADKVNIRLVEVDYTV